MMRVKQICPQKGNLIAAIAVHEPRRNEWKYFIILFKQILIIINGLLGNINIWENIYFDQEKGLLIF